MSQLVKGVFSIHEAVGSIPLRQEDQKFRGSIPSRQEDQKFRVILGSVGSSRPA